MSRFYKGQKIVALRDIPPSPVFGHKEGLVKDNIYVCAGPEISCCPIGEKAIYLEGRKYLLLGNVLCNKCNSIRGGDRVAYDERHFAPLEEEKATRSFEITATFPKWLEQPEVEIEAVPEHAPLKPQEV